MQQDGRLLLFPVWQAKKGERNLKGKERSANGWCAVIYFLLFHRFSALQHLFTYMDLDSDMQLPTQSFCPREN